MKTVMALTSVFLLTIFSACKKEDTAVCQLNGTSIPGNYKVISYKEDGVELINDQTVFDPCELDNVFVINPDGTYTMTEGAVSCDPATSYSGTWSLAGNIFYWDSDDYTVSGFSCTGFRLAYQYTDPLDPSQDYSEEITLQRQ